MTTSKNEISERFLFLFLEEFYFSFGLFSVLLMFYQVYIALILIFF